MDLPDAGGSTRPPQRVDHYPDGHPDLDEIVGRGQIKVLKAYNAKRAAETATKPAEPGLPKQ